MNPQDNPNLPLERFAAARLAAENEEREGRLARRIISPKSFHYEVPLGDGKIRHEFEMNGVKGSFVADEGMTLYLRPYFDVDQRGNDLRGCDLFDADETLAARFYVCAWVNE